MPHLRRRLTTVLAVAAMALCWLAGATAVAQDYPSRIIRIVVAFPAGGPTDIVARLLADKLKAILGQSVIVENKPGANGAIGADYVAKGEADGHLLFLTTARRGRGDAAYEQAELRLAARFRADHAWWCARPRSWWSSPSTPANSAKDLVALAKDKPGAIPFASTGSGSMPHLAIELCQSAAGVKFLHVPYRGAAPALTDLLGGQVQALFADTPVLLPHIRGGKLKPIAAAAASRNPLLPDVATLVEQGFADTMADNWYGLLAPARTPPAVVAKLHDAVVAALNAPDIREKLVQSGAVPSPTSSAEFGKILSRRARALGPRGAREGHQGGMRRTGREDAMRKTARFAVSA